MEHDLENVAREYRSQQAEYGKIKEAIVIKIESLLKEAEISAEVESRVKDIKSFVTKAIRKDYEDPMRDIKDKVGVRVITTYESNLQKIEELIHGNFDVSDSQDKASELEHNELGYLGIHFEINFNPSDIKIFSIQAPFICEIQLRTQAQDVWARISHELDYKKPKLSVPPSKALVEVRRSIYRLIALVEIFDKEASAAQKAILEQNDYQEPKLLAYLMKEYSRFTDRDFDRTLSLENLSFLKTLLTDKEINMFEEMLLQFINTNEAKIQDIYQRYLNDNRNIYETSFLFQPEALLVFERLQKDRFRIIQEWGNSNLPMEILYFLGADVWGLNLPDR